MTACGCHDVTTFGHLDQCPVYGALQRAQTPQEALDRVVYLIHQPETSKAAGDRYSARKARTWADRRARSAAAKGTR